MPILIYWKAKFFREIIVDENKIIVSNFGRIYRDYKIGISYGSKNIYGYMNCSINKYVYLLHRLAALAFVERPLHLQNVDYKFLVVNHKDFNRENNNTNNLEWCTYQENIQHAYTNKNHKGQRAVVQYDLQGRMLNQYISASSAARDVGGYTNSSIVACCNGKALMAYNYIWRHEEDPLDSIPQDKNKSPVTQYDLTGKFLANFNSIKEAGNETNINPVCISYCCAGSLITAGNFIWRYRDEPVGVIRQNQSCSSVIQYDRNERSIREFKSIKEASEITKICSSNISECCRGKRRTAGDFIWKYKIIT